MNILRLVIDADIISRDEALAARLPSQTGFAGSRALTGHGVSRNPRLLLLPAPTIRRPTTTLAHYWCSGKGKAWETTVFLVLAVSGVGAIVLAFLAGFAK